MNIFPSIRKKITKPAGIQSKYVRKSPQSHKPFKASNFNNNNILKSQRNFEDDQEFFSLSEIDDDKKIKGEFNEFLPLYNYFYQSN